MLVVSPARSHFILLPGVLPVPAVGQVRREEFPAPAEVVLEAGKGSR